MHRRRCGDGHRVPARRCRWIAKPLCTATSADASNVALHDIARAVVGKASAYVAFRDIARAAVGKASAYVAFRDMLGPDDKVWVRVRSSVLESDERILEVLAHEMNIATIVEGYRTSMLTRGELFGWLTAILSMHPEQLAPALAALDFDPDLRGRFQAWLDNLDAATEILHHGEILRPSERLLSALARPSAAPPRQSSPRGQGIEAAELARMRAAASKAKLEV